MNNNDEKILRLHHQGAKVSEIMRETNLSRSKVYQVIHNEKTGIKVSYSKRGRKLGEKRLLSPEQEDALYQQLTTTKPDTYAFSSSTKLWTRRLIQALIGTWDIMASDHTVLNYLRRFDLLHSQPDTPGSITTNGQSILTISVIRFTAKGMARENKPYPTYMIYTYDKRGTYYFCCYPERYINTRKNHMLYIIHDFLCRVPDLQKYSDIVCFLPPEHYLNSLRSLWRESTFCKEVPAERICFQKTEYHK